MLYLCLLEWLRLLLLDLFLHTLLKLLTNCKVFLSLLLLLLILHQLYLLGCKLLLFNSLLVACFLWRLFFIFVVLLVGFVEEFLEFLVHFTEHLTLLKKSLQLLWIVLSHFCQLFIRFTKILIKFLLC